MRFSLQSLMVVVLFAAMLINLYATWRSADNTIIENKRLRASLNQGMGLIAESEPSTQSQSIEQSTFWYQGVGEQQDALYNQLRADFVASVSSIQINPKPDHVSVIDVPTLPDLRRVFDKRWMIHAPETTKLRVQVDFIRDNNTQAMASEFSNESSVSIQLHPGENIIQADLIRRSNDQGDCSFRVLHDQHKVLERLVTSRRPLGYSASIFPYHTQKDYPVLGKPLPLLADFRVSRSSAIVRIRVDLDRRTPE